MKANELRIGNYVYDSNKQVTKSVTKSDFMSLDYKIEIGRIEPIQLTEEWIINFGFNLYKELKYCKKYTTHDFLGLIKFMITYNKGNFSEDLKSVAFFGGYLDHLNDTSINYVHQLQNLYFSLTNEELKIN